MCVFIHCLFVGLGSSYPLLPTTTTPPTHKHTHTTPLASFLQGYRSLEDIRNQASLTTQQAIGLKHYDDFLERIPREEATEIEQTVSKYLREVRRARPCYTFRAWLKAKNF